MPEIARQCASGPAPILDIKRPVEAIGLGHLGNFFFGSVIARQFGGKIARQPQKAESDDGHRNGNQYGNKQPVDQVVEHAAASLLALVRHRFRYGFST